MFEALHGERPFRGASLHALYEAIERGEHVLPSQRVPRRLTRLIERGLAFVAARREANMDEIARELDAIATARSLPPLVIVAGALASVAVVAVAAVLAWPHDSSDSAETPATAVRDAGVRANPSPSPSAQPSAPRARDAGTLASAAHPGLQDAGIATARRQPDAATVGAAPESLHPIPPEHRAAVVRALRELGYRGLTFDGDPEANLSELRTKLAAVPPDERTDAVMWQVAIGHIERKRGDCESAIRAYEAASGEANAFFEKLGQIGRAHDRRYLEWQRRGWFGIALCKVELDAPDARQYLNKMGAYDHWVDPEEIDLARGIVAYEMGDRSLGNLLLDQLLHAQDPHVRATFSSWASAIGLPIRWP
jgi:hypothetical protein